MVGRGRGRESAWMDRMEGMRMLVRRGLLHRCDWLVGGAWAKAGLCALALGTMPRARAITTVTRYPTIVIGSR